MHSQRAFVAPTRTIAVLVTLLLAITITFSAAPDAAAQEPEAVSGVVRTGDQTLPGVNVEVDDAQATTGSDGTFDLTTTPTQKLVTLSRDATPAYPELHQVPRFSLSKPVDFGVTGTACPDGFSADDSLGGICARFEPASQRPSTCPDGSLGVPGDCYILVAKGPRGNASCEVGILVGTNCVTIGDPPVNGPLECPVSATVIQDGDECYTLIAPPVGAGACDPAYFAFGGVCKANNTGTNLAEVVAFTCPAPATGEVTTENLHTTDGQIKIESCEYRPLSVQGECPTGTTPDSNGVDCRRPVELRPGPKMCADGFVILDGKCIRYEAPVSTEPGCPAGSVEDAAGDCRKPVADAKGTYFCEDETAALNGKSCVFTAGFLPPFVDLALPALVSLQVNVTGGYYSNCDASLPDSCVIDDFCTTELAVAGECDEVFVEVVSTSGAGEYAGTWHTWGDTVDNSVVLPTFGESSNVIIRIGTLDAGVEEFPWDGNNPTTIDLGGPPPPLIDWYPDIDGDTWGDDFAEPSLSADRPGLTFVDRAGDCDDTTDQISPDAVDIEFNGIDEDCDGQDAQPQSVRITGTVSIDGQGTDQVSPLDARGKRRGIRSDGTFRMLYPTSNPSTFFGFASDASSDLPAVQARALFNPQIEREINLDLPAVEQLEVRVFDNHLASECSVDLPICGQVQVQTYGSFNGLQEGTWNNPLTDAPDGVVVQPVFVGSANPIIKISVNGRRSVYEWDGSNPFIIDLSRPIPTCLGLPITIDMTRGHNGIGTDGDDVIWGTSGPDQIQGMGGNDLICGRGGDDDIDGGPGADRVHSGRGDDIVRDLSGNNEIWSGPGNDYVVVGNGSSRVFGGSDHDTVYSYAGDHFIAGGSGSDTLIGGEGAETMVGGSGNDVLIGRGGNNVLHGGSGFDGCWVAAGASHNTTGCEYGSTTRFR